MPQKSVSYAIARTRVLENRLLTMERLQRLLDAPSIADLLRILSEYGYGGNAQETDIQKLIDRELKEAYEYVRRVTPNERAIGVLLLKGDCHNVKCILKGRLLEFDATSYLRDFGTVDSKILYEAMQNNNPKLLPDNMKLAAQEVLGRLELGNAEVQWMECLLDAACFADMSEYAQKSGEAITVAFVQTMADLQNLLTLLRLKRSKNESTAQALRRALLPGGAVQNELFLSALDIGEEELLSHLNLRKYQTVLKPGLELLSKTGSFGLLERLKDDILLRPLRDKRYAREGVAPLLGYLLAKEREAQALRLIYMSKRNEVPKAMTQERLRELYA